MFKSIKGVPSLELIHEFSRLAESDDEHMIAKKLYGSLESFYTYHKFDIIYNVLSKIVLILVLFLAPELSDLELTKFVPITLLLLLFILFGSFFIHQKSLKNVNVLSRYISVPFEKLLSIVIDRYRLSLAEHLPKSPDIKAICNDIGRGFFARHEINASISSVVGSVIGVLIITILSIHTEKPFPYSLLLLVIILTLIVISLRTLGSSFNRASNKLVWVIDSLHSRYRDSQPLLTETRVDIEESGYFEQTNSVISVTSKINAIHSFSNQFLTYLFVVIPLVTKGEQTVPLLAAVIISNYLSAAFSISGMNSVQTAAARITQLEQLRRSISDCNEELTEEKYQIMSSNICNDASRTEDTHIVGGMKVKELDYHVGRKSGKTHIHTRSLLFPSQKISILYAESGKGKSVLGRALTMRYSDLSAKFIGRGDQDFRCFGSLNKALSLLHFSTLRHIETSYRNAMSVYLYNSSIQNVFIDKIGELSTSEDISNVMRYYAENSVYYGSIGQFYDIEMILTKSKATDPRELSKDSRMRLAKLFRDLSEGLTEEEVKGIDEPIVRITLLAEYIAFTHLQKFIPEANQFFMDAILSEPPISQGQRRRILFALDILMKGVFYVADELLANLDFESAKSMLDEIMAYSAEYNAPILLLDQELNMSVVDHLRKSRRLGNIYTFKRLGEKELEIVPRKISE